jgi:hypothetical protein
MECASVRTLLAVVKVLRVDVDVDVRCSIVTPSDRVAWSRVQCTVRTRRVHRNGTIECLRAVSLRNRA